MSPLTSSSWNSGHGTGSAVAPKAAASLTKKSSSNWSQSTAPSDPTAARAIEP